MTGYEIDVACPCGKTHRVQLDASGHYSGPQPCDHGKTWRVQVEAEEWRQIVDAEQAKVKH